MKDSILKYIEISTAFNNRATAVDLFCKQSQRVCEKLASKLAADKPKTPQEFERSEYLKDFVVKVSKNNEATIELLTYIKGFLIDILDDSRVLIDGAILRDKLKFQSDTIEIMMKQRDDITGVLFEDAKNEIIRRNKANT